jgi:hypothetical protein
MKNPQKHTFSLKIMHFVTLSDFSLLYRHDYLEKHWNLCADVRGSPWNKIV